MPKLNPRVKFLPNGNVVLSGINWYWLSSILTSASLYNYDELDKIEETVAKVVEGHNDPDYEDRTRKDYTYHHEIQLWLLKRLEANVDAPRRAKYGRKLTLKQRLQENERTRQLIRSIIEEHRNKEHDTKRA